MTKEQIYKSQMTELGIYEPVFDPEIRTLARIERELTRAMKAWSDTAPPGGKPSFLDDHYPVIQKLRAEALQHREALGLTPKALRKLTGAAGTDAPLQKDLITEKLDRIAERVAGYDFAPGSSPVAGLYIEGEQGPELVVPRDSADHQTTLWGGDLRQDPFEGIPAADEAAEISDRMDADLKHAVAEDMG